MVGAEDELDAHWPDWRELRAWLDALPLAETNTP